MDERGSFCHLESWERLRCSKHWRSFHSIAYSRICSRISSGKSMKAERFVLAVGMSARRRWISRLFSNLVSSQFFRASSQEMESREIYTKYQDQNDNSRRSAEVKKGDMTYLCRSRSHQFWLRHREPKDFPGSKETIEANIWASQLEAEHEKFEGLLSLHQ